LDHERRQNFIISAYNFFLEYESLESVSDIPLIAYHSIQEKELYLSLRDFIGEIVRLKEIMTVKGDIKIY